MELQRACRKGVWPLVGTGAGNEKSGGASKELGLPIDE
jgi:hypothetical protein